ncbi:DinB family protein [bacterium]|nr:DinB family protein [bacterium]
MVIRLQSLESENIFGLIEMLFRIYIESDMDTITSTKQDGISTDNLKTALKSQYRAEFAMLRQTIESCSERLWLSEDYENQFWHIAYHALFYTHLYAQIDEKSFSTWVKHLNNYQYMGALPYPPHDLVKIGLPYSKDDILQYLDICMDNIGNWVDKLDLNAPECGFWWYKMNKLEHQFNNLRHIQHHVGQLADRVREVEDVGTEWVGGKG